MITPERMVEMATDITTLHIIQHKRTKTHYVVVSKQKAKINGEWFHGICYYPENDDVQKDEYFWRPVTDFNGFIEVK